MTTTEFWQLLGPSDASAPLISHGAARALMGWYDGNPDNASRDRVEAALKLFRWVRSVGPLEYLPPEMRQARIRDGAARFGLSTESLVRHIIDADDLLFGTVAAGIKTRLIVAIEGIDGSGKTTQTSLLAKACEGRGLSVVTESFPRYESFFGRQIRALLDGEGPISAETVDPRSMALWYALDRWSMFRRHGDLPDVLVFNRYSLSNAVYQAARSEGDAGEEVFSWVLDLEHRELGLPSPDVTVVLDLPPGVSLSRSQDRSLNGERSAAPDVYERSLRLLAAARDRYLEAAQRLPAVVVVAGVQSDGSERSPADIHAEVLAAVELWLH